MWTQKQRDVKARRITKERIDKLVPPAIGSRILYDGEVPGFGARITANGVVSFVLTYWIHGRQRRYTLGRYPTVSVSEARDDAIELRKAIRQGKDPLAARALERAAPLVTDLAQRYLTEYAEPNNRPSSVRNARQMLAGIILLNLGRLPVAAVTRDDIARLHGSLQATPYRANRLRALLSKMFALAVDWGMRGDNPVTGVRRYREERRERWLRGQELERLTAALAKHPNQQASNAVRLLLLTGARKSEVLRATWSQFDLERGTWTKPSSHTKQQRTEHVPLSRAALRLLHEMKRHADGDYLFPGRRAGEPLHDLKNVWAEICRVAELDGARIHDLRHTYASHLVSSGVPLPVVGKLLGHTQLQTTERYAHLADTPLREATNRFGKMVEKLANRG